MISADPAILTEAAPWRQTFSSAPPEPQVPEAPAHANPLAVAWENQKDNASGTSYRECFSSCQAAANTTPSAPGTEVQYHKLMKGEQEACRGGTSKPCFRSLVGMSVSGRAAESRLFCLAKQGSSTGPTHRLTQTRVLLLQSANGLKNTE